MLYQHYLQYEWIKRATEKQNRNHLRFLKRRADHKKLKPIGAKQIVKIIEKGF